MKLRRRLIWFFGVLAALLGIAIALGVGLAWEAMGTAPTGQRAERVAASPNWSDGVFVNKQPLYNDIVGSLTTEQSDHLTPEQPLPVVTDTAERLKAAPGPLRITWLGHSTLLIELAGKRILTDPIFGDSPFPIPSIGPQRWYAPPLPLEALRDVDLVVISHDHYDHLDAPTIKRIAQWQAPIFAPLGVGAHLEYWGVAPERITELDWWQERQLDELKVVCVPSRHASGRQVFDQDRTLWAGYAFIGPQRRALFSGDTGIFDDMAKIGSEYGPFDAVMIEVGAYNQAWPDWHIGPEQAMVAHRMLRGKLFIPIHWGLFFLAPHGWTEPIERTWAAATKQEVQFVTPRPGEVIDVDNPPTPNRWWPEVPWNTAEQDPIISTKSGDPNVRYPAP